MLGTALLRGMVLALLLRATGKHAGCYERPDPGPSACIYHDPPLLFDLSVDPGTHAPARRPFCRTNAPRSLAAYMHDRGMPIAGEERPIDPKSSEGAAVLKAMAQQLHLQMVSINTTARSEATYASGPAGKAANCCNLSHTECRCNPGSEGEHGRGLPVDAPTPAVTNP